MSVVEGALRLAMEPNLWTVRLGDGSEIQVLAHGYSKDGDDCVFSLLFEGQPHYLVTSLRVPLRLLGDDFS